MSAPPWPEIIATAQFSPGVGMYPDAVGVNVATGYVYVANYDSSDVTVISGTQAIANVRAGVAKGMAAQGKPTTAKPAKKAKRKMSAAGRAALAAAAKARWAKAKAAGKSRLEY